MTERNKNVNFQVETTLTELSSAATETPADREAIELKEIKMHVEPPVYEQSNVITVQPQRENNPQRRPIPIYTSDWVTTPRSQLNSFSGMYFLAGVEQLQIQRIVDLSTLLGTSGKGKQYRVKVPNAETIFFVTESRVGNGKNILCNTGELTFNIIDQCGETAFIVTKNATCKYILGKTHKIAVESKNFIGTVEQNFTIIGPSFTVYDESRMPLCNIYGPNVCSCCMYKESQFQIVSADDSHQIASLIHQWDNNLYDYILLLTFPVDTNIKLKSLLLGASFLVECLYFEKVKRTARD